MFGIGSFIPERFIDWFNPKEYSKWYHVLWFPIVALPILGIWIVFAFVINEIPRKIKKLSR